jgi:hypothetical protein
LPVLNVFRMFARMSGERIRARRRGRSLDDILAHSVRDMPTSVRLGVPRWQQICVLVWHYR